MILGYRNARSPSKLSYTSAISSQVIKYTIHTVRFSLPYMHAMMTSHLEPNPKDIKIVELASNLQIQN